ncbi:MAG TPA: sulfur carrier protein ThiS [Acidobacteriaceae bacterium]|jgi:sulfur carrier protein|nr:sulfur carrier protein ThiS [Acidobacteriaceae bacterium]
MDLVINGQPRSFPALLADATLLDLLNALALKADRIALEHNGSIVSRPAWPATAIADGDRFEIVHFVGGGLGSPRPPIQIRSSSLYCDSGRVAELSSAHEPKAALGCSLHCEHRR